MNISETPRGTYRIDWRGGYLELNLTPMNPHVGARYAHVLPEDVLSNSIHDFVGVTALGFDLAPVNPRIVWDNREHHWWDGFEGCFEPRNTVVNSPAVRRVQADGSVEASFYFIANHVQTTVAWKIHDPQDSPHRAKWDTRITVENPRPLVLNNYLQLFACYHKPGSNYYWDVGNRIERCGAGGFYATCDQETLDRIWSTPVKRTLDRYRGNAEFVCAQYARPMLLSERCDWFGGGRHVLMVDPAACAALVTWLGQARDHMVGPAGGRLAPGESFTARIRHLVTTVDDVRDVQRLWDKFEDEALSGTGGA